MTRFNLIPSPRDLKRLKLTYRVFGVVGPALVGREALANELRSRLGSDRFEVRVYDEIPPDLSPRDLLSTYWIPGAQGLDAWRLGPVEVGAYLRRHQLGEVANFVIEDLVAHGRTVPAWLEYFVSGALRRHTGLREDRWNELWPELRAEADRHFCAAALGRLSAGSQTVVREAYDIRYDHGARREILERLSRTELALLRYHKILDAEGRLDPTLGFSPPQDQRSVEPLPTLSPDTGIRTKMEHLHRLSRLAPNEAARCIDTWLWDLVADCTIPEFCELTTLASPQLGLLAFQFRAHALAHGLQSVVAVHEIETRLRPTPVGTAPWLRLKASLTRVLRFGGEVNLSSQHAREMLPWLGKVQDPVAEALARKEAAASLRFGDPDAAAHLLSDYPVPNATAVATVEPDPRVRPWIEAELALARGLVKYVRDEVAAGMEEIEVAGKLFEKIFLRADRLLCMSNYFQGRLMSGAALDPAAESEGIETCRALGAIFVRNSFLDRSLAQAYWRGDTEWIERQTRDFGDLKLLDDSAARRVIALIDLGRISEARVLYSFCVNKGLLLNAFWRPTLRTVWAQVDRSLDSSFIETLEVRDDKARVEIETTYMSHLFNSWRVPSIAPLKRNLDSLTLDTNDLFRLPMIAFAEFMSGGAMLNPIEQVEASLHRSILKRADIATVMLAPMAGLLRIAKGDALGAKATLLNLPVLPRQTFGNGLRRVLQVFLEVLDGRSSTSQQLTQIEGALPQESAGHFRSFVDRLAHVCRVSLVQKAEITSPAGRAVQEVDRAFAQVAEFRGIGLDLIRGSAYVFGKPVDRASNPILYRLIELLVLNRGAPLDIERASRTIWGQAHNPMIHTPRLHTLIFRLREFLPLELAPQVRFADGQLELLSSVPIFVVAKHRDPGQISDTGEWVLDYIKRNGQISNRILTRLRNISPATAKRELKSLTDRGLISLRGAGRGAAYYPGA